MTDAAARARAVADELLAGSRVSEDEARARADLARDPTYWRGLAPGLSIGGDARSGSRHLADDDVRAIAASLAVQGFFEARDVVGAGLLAGVNCAIDAVVRERWPAVFAWVFDELWALARLPDVAAILTARLGSGYAQIPHIWTHVVAPAVGSSGWAPHFDGQGARRLSVWIALTDATVANGCIHLVPRGSLPSAFARDWKAFPEIAIADAVAALHAVRALPVAAGSVLGWGFDVLHWGGTCTAIETPRRALSLEFMARDEPVRSDETPLVAATGPLPGLPQRLAMIAAAIVAYEKFEGGLARCRPIAERLGG